jgi:hypothetical protein
MPTKAKFYIGTVVTLGAIVLLACLVSDPSLPDLRRFLECLALGALAATFKIKLPGMQSSISLNFVLFIIAIAGLSVGEAVIIAAVTAVVQTLWRRRTRATVSQALFNVGALITSVFTADVLTAQLRKGDGQVPGLVLAGVIFFFVNTWLVSIVLALLKEKPALEVWRRCHAWAFAYYVAGAVLAIVVSQYAQICGWDKALAMLPGLYLMYAYYDAHLNGLESAKAS